MTTYNATSIVLISGDGSPPATLWLAVRATSYELKIPQINYSAWGQSTYFFNANAYRYTNSTISGGSAFTPAPLREGSAAATATARAGNTLSFTGTQIPIDTQYSGGGAATPTGTNPPVATQTGTISFPFDFTVAPGSVVAVAVTCNFTVGTGTGSISATIPFEELRLSWHY